MDHRIRLALQMGSYDKVSGKIEADETFIGGKARNLHKDVQKRKISAPGPKGKTVVMGILERGRSLRYRGREQSPTDVQGQIRKHVEVGSEVFTDALQSYDTLSDEYKHQVVAMP